MTQAALLCGALVSPVHASTDIEFIGTLVADPCQVGMDGEEQEVKLGNIVARTFLNNNSTAAKTFALHLMECDLSLGSQISVTFLGSEDTTQPGAFATTGEAKGIAIRLSDLSGNTVRPNTPQPMTELQADETVLTWQAQVTATTFSEVTEGEFFATVTFSLAYE